MYNFKFYLEGIEMHSRGEYPEFEIESMLLGDIRYAGKRFFKSWKTTISLSLKEMPFSVNYDDVKPDIFIEESGTPN